MSLSVCFSKGWFPYDYERCDRRDGYRKTLKELNHGILRYWNQKVETAEGKS